MNIENVINECFQCPITCEIMKDPVICADGHSYEREAIAHWFNNGEKKSPMTGLILSSTILIPNHNLRNAIEMLRSSIFKKEQKIVNKEEYKHDLFSENKHKCKSCNCCLGYDDVELHDLKCIYYLPVKCNTYNICKKRWCTLDIMSIKRAKKFIRKMKLNLLMCRNFFFN